MGNRGGRIHNAEREICRNHVSKRWIYCVTSFRGRRRQIMGDGYTELFFADAATALASGHRPCFECQRTQANLFATYWANSNGARAMADDMDRVLHTARMSKSRDRAFWTDLPNGTICQSGDTILLKSADRAWFWDWEQYSEASVPARNVIALTPKPIRDVLAAGFVPLGLPGSQPE